MTSNAGVYAGLSSKQAREAVIADLYKKDLIEKIDEKYQNRIGTCYRCGKVLEQLPLPQFFIKVQDPHKNLAQAALAALDTKETVIHGAGREKILRHWLENLHDWNISRQIVWGIRIPVWYEVTGYEKSITVSFITSTKELKQGVLSELLQQHTLAEIQTGLQQLFADHTVPYLIADKQPAGEKVYLPETDTFDTWFSSAQWPVITLQTMNTDDFARFYPTSVMETGYDILPFWVMRMMLLGIYRTGKSPFKEVYLHGLVRDEKGQKMSKSKGNVINPLQIVATHGADALRMALIIRSTPGQDKSVGEQDFKAARNFANKIWNASRFILLQHEKQESTATSDAAYEKQAQEKMQEIFTAVTKNMHELKLGIAADTLYSEFWHWLCDEVLEQQKNNRISLPEVTRLLIVFLKLLHPFMPFVTEAVWQELYAQKLVQEPLLISSSWE
jgi:valyl-tRNA synthetase